MTISKPSRSLSSLLLGATLVAGVGAGCGVEVRPRMPTLQAHAVVAPASFTAQSAPAYESSPGYAAPAAEAGPAPMPDDVATTGQYVQSGGATPQTAEVVAVGSTLLGRVAPGARRYYVMDLAVGDTFEIKAYMMPLADSRGSFYLKIFEPDDVRLGKIDNYIYESTEWKRATVSVTAKQAGRHAIQVSSEAAADYKFLINGKVSSK